MTPAAQRYLLRIKTFEREGRMVGPLPLEVEMDRAAELDLLWADLSEEEQDQVEAALVARVPSHRWEELVEYVDVSVVNGATWPPRRARLRRRRRPVAVLRATFLRLLSSNKETFGLTPQDVESFLAEMEENNRADMPL